MIKKRIVFEDKWLIVYSKPRRLPTLPTKEQHRYNLKRYLQNYLGVMPHLPSRLDTSTEGLVIASKLTTSHNKLQRMFESRRIKKFYLLEVQGHPSWDEFEANDPIGRDPSHPILRKVIEGGQDARTKFSKLSASSAGTLLVAMPETGRTHQIRVHAAHIGHPILGDSFYGGAISLGGCEPKELRLMSYGLFLTHPISGATLSLSVPERLLPNWLQSFSEGLAERVFFLTNHSCGNLQCRANP